MRACRSNSEAIKWILLTMADLSLNRVVAPAELTPNALFGKPPATKGKLRGNNFKTYEFNVIMFMSMLCCLIQEFPNFNLKANHMLI